MVPPIHPSTTFVRDGNYELVGNYGYSREQNPTYDQVEAVLACLEGGVEAQVYASGVVAAGAVFETVNAGQHILAPNMMYYGLKEWLVWISEKRSIGLDFVDSTRPDAVRQKIRTLRPKLGAFRARLRRGCFCVECAPCRFATNGLPKTRCGSPNIFRATPRWNPFCIRGWKSIRDIPLPASK